MANQITRHIPNFVTCCNLFSGCIASVMAFQAYYEAAILFIILGATFDFFDGMLARLLKVSGPLGKELDSLADDITFGLAPAMLLFCYLKPMIGWWALIALLIAAFSALRLAKFNIDERQTTSFIGLATPPNAIFWASLVCYLQTATLPTWAPWVLLAGSLLSCYLLVSEIPFFSFKSAGKNKRHLAIFAFGCCFILGSCCTAAFIEHQLSIAVLGGAISILWYTVYNLCTLRKQ